MRTLKEMVNNNQRVTFSYFRDKELWYSTECGFLFPVPINDTGTAVFNASDKAILFMRYIRKYIDFLHKSKEEQINDGDLLG